MTTLARRNSSIHKIREYTLPRIQLNDEYEVIHVMQEAWRGRLLLVEHRRTRHEVVLKAIHKEVTSKMEFFKEFHYNYYLSPHTHILNAYDVAFETPDYYVFAQEYAPFGDLTVNLSESGLGETNVKKIAPQIVSALEFMHSKDLVHRNINTDNILVFNIDFSEIKLCDFGSTRKNGAIIKRKMVSLPYAPPEVVDTVQNESFIVSTKQDVWQLGVLLYILLTGALPWQKADLSDPHYLEYINWRKRKTLKTPKRFTNFTTRLLRMFKRLFDPKPDKRPSVQEVYKYLEDKWLIRSMKRQDNDLDNQSVCYSTFSIHSSKMEKDKVLHALKAHGIETTVDRIAKRKRIHEWIEKSLSNNLIFVENETKNTKELVKSNKPVEFSEESKEKSVKNIINLNVVKNFETFHLQERRNSAHIVDGLKWEAGVVVCKENKNIPSFESNNESSRLIKPSTNSSEFQIFDSEKNAPYKVSNQSVQDILTNPVTSALKTPNNVKRTSSFQDKSERQLILNTTTPCNNYKEIHSSNTCYIQSSPRISLSSTKARSKSQRLHKSPSSQRKSRTSSKQNEVFKSNLVYTEAKQHPNCPVQGRLSGPRRRRAECFQRSRSMARNHNYRFDVQRIQPETTKEPKLCTSTLMLSANCNEESCSDNSLASVIPASYYK